GYGAGL
ncbi:unnamed protein product, partial [Fusarium fujikuroi]